MNMKNYADQGGCYQPKPMADVDIALQDIIQKPNSIIVLLFKIFPEL